MRVLIGSVIYPQAMIYISDFINAINGQTFNSFDVLLVNDGIKEEIVQNICSKIRRKVVMLPTIEDATVSQNRVALLQGAKNLGYDLAILADVDDSFSQQRVDKIVKSVNEREVSFYYNQLIRYDNGIPFFKNLPSQIECDEEILESNFLGLSNTAINLNKISDEFIVDLKKGQTQIFDWYLFSRILLRGGNGIYVDGCETFYRIHANNIAGAVKEDQEELEIKKEIGIKIDHYSLLKNFGKKYSDLLKKYKEIQESQKYDQYRNQEKNGYWWELMKIY